MNFTLELLKITFHKLLIRNTQSDIGLEIQILLEKKIYQKVKKV